MVSKAFQAFSSGSREFKECFKESHGRFRFRGSRGVFCFYGFFMGSQEVFQEVFQVVLLTFQGHSGLFF